jgi:energy-coupling factor transporter ATP-binding protein EcfA2
MSVVDAAERFVAKPTAATLAESAVEDVIVVEGVRMRYGATEAVAGINLCVAGGEIFAFLGPNGAGKTTTVEILEGFRERTKGTVSVLGVATPAAGAACGACNAPIHFNAWRAVKWKGRTRQSVGPPPVVAALRALQVRHEDLAAAALEVGMWPV